MNRKFLIKAGAARSLADARYFSSRMVDVIGFCFDRNSPNYINPVEAQEIIKWIEGPKIAGEFCNQSVDEILNIASILRLDFLQWKGNVPDEKFMAINLPKIICPNLENGDHEALNEVTSRFNSKRDYFMLEEKWFKSSAEFLMETAPVILNLTSNHCPSDFMEIKPAGINFDLGNEIQSGVKSYHDFDVLLESLQ